MTPADDVNPGRVAMNDFQSRVLGLEPPPQFFALPAGQFPPLQSPECGHLSLCHGTLPLLLEFAGLGSVGDPLHNLSGWVELAFSGVSPPNNRPQSTEVTLGVGH
jgi:hypothetical protein